MKRLIVLLVIFLLLAIACVYIIIPNQILIGRTVIVNANREGLMRKLYDEKQWSHWWPGTTTKNDTTKTFIYNNSSFSIEKLTLNSILISIAQKKLAIPSALNVIEKNTDTTQIIWTGEITTSYNPVRRLQIYLASQKILEDIDQILKKITDHFSKIENVYDYKITRASVVDSFLISTYATSKIYPSIDFTYRLVDQLKKYIADNGAKESGFPMLNVSTIDGVNFLTRVGIPVNQMIPSSKEISFKRMPAGGNMLIVDIKGGQASVNNALKQMQNFILDYHESAPAIPFFSLITDRRKDPDTSKWLTRIYYPVM